MAIIDTQEIEGTSPAGKTVRKISVSVADDGRVVVALNSATGQFLGDCWLEPDDVRELYYTVGWAWTHDVVEARSERMQGGAS